MNKSISSPGGMYPTDPLGPNKLVEFWYPPEEEKPWRNCASPKSPSRAT